MWMTMKRCVSVGRAIRLMFCLMGCLTASVGTTAYGEELAAGPFPRGSGVINVRDFGAMGDGVTDDLPALRRAIDSAPANRCTFYFPDGVYLCSGPLRFKPAGKEEIVWFTIRGQSRDGTIIKLADHAQPFQDPAKRVSFIQLKQGNEAFEQRLLDFTIDVGAANPGAVGLQYSSCNGGSLTRLTIRSSDPAGVGHTGLDSDRGAVGRCYISDLSVSGFDYGITLSSVVCGFGYEHIYLTKQHKAGVLVRENNAGFIDVTSDNAVPAFVVDQGANVAIINAKLRGGSADTSAILNSDGAVFVRNVRSEGYGSAILDKGKPVAGSLVEEFNSEAVVSPFPSDNRSLNLPIETSPDVPMATENNFADWVNVIDFGAKPGPQSDDTDAVERAVASARKASKRTLFFPPGAYHLSRTIDLSNIRRVQGMNSTVTSTSTTKNWPHDPFFAGHTDPVLFRFGPGEAVVVVEDISIRGMIDHADANTLVFRRGAGTHYRNSIDGGRAFFDDYGAGTSYAVKGTHQKLWVRFWDGHGVGTGPWYLPQDGRRQVYLDNDGATVWLFALHGESGNPVCTARTRNGGSTEVISFNAGAPWLDDDKFPPEVITEFINRDARFSLSAGSVSYKTVAEDTRGEWTRLAQSPRGRTLVVVKPFSDASPPPAVSGLRATPAGEWPFKISLQWDPAEDPDSGVAGYEVLRDGQRIAYTSEPAFTDTLPQDDAEARYLVRAINGAMQSSRDASVTARSAPDTTELKSLACFAEAEVPDGGIWIEPAKKAGGDRRYQPGEVRSALHVLFSKPIERAGAEQVGNYAVTDAAGGAVQIASAALEADSRTVTLIAAAPLQSGGQYQVLVKEVRDVARSSHLLTNTKISTTATGPGGGLATLFQSGAVFDAAAPSAARATRLSSPWFDWRDLTPAPFSASDRGAFVARWEGTIRAERSEPCTFYAVSPDGVRLSVDGHVVLDTWQASQKFSETGANEWPATPIDLVAGRKYSIKLEFLKRGPNARIRLEWQSPSRPQRMVVGDANLYAPDDQLRETLNASPAAKTGEHGITISYINSIFGPGDSHNEKRVEPMINFDWGNGPMLPGMSNEGRANMRGWIVAPQSGRYRFRADIAAWDTLKIWIDGRQIINCNQRFNARSGWFDGDIDLVAGRPVPISVEFRDKDWTTADSPAKAQLFWTPPGATQDIVPTEAFLPFNGE